jgi:hypothetical protein
MAVHNGWKSIAGGGSDPPEDPAAGRPKVAEATFIILYLTGVGL